MKVTSRGELALKAMVELAQDEASGGQGLSATEIARRTRASVKFLEQVLTQLRVSGYLVSTLGRLGGYRLARSADEIVVGQVHRVIDGPLAPAPCASISQHHTCDWCLSEDTCTLKNLWVSVREAIS